MGCSSEHMFLSVLLPGLRSLRSDDALLHLLLPESSGLSAHLLLPAVLPASLPSCLRCNRSRSGLLQLRSLSLIRQCLFLLHCLLRYLHPLPGTDRLHLYNPALQSWSSSSRFHRFLPAMCISGIWSEPAEFPLFYASSCLLRILFHR